MPLRLSPFKHNPETDTASAELVWTEFDKGAKQWASAAIHEAHAQLAQELVALVLKERRDEIMAAITSEMLVDVVKDGIARAISDRIFGQKPREYK